MLKQRFEQDGFVTIDSVIPEDECDDLIKILSSRFDVDKKAGVRNLISDDDIRRFASDRRLIKITKQLTERELIPYKATLFNKTDETNWLVKFHQDMALPVENAVEGDGWGPVSIKDGVTFVHAPTEALKKIVALRIHLDPSTSENGPLRVIPGSHQKRLRSDSEFESAMQLSPQVECLATKGAVIAMRPLLLHASSKSINDKPRRVLHIEYAEDLKISDNILLVSA